MGGYTSAPPQRKQTCPISSAPPSHTQVLLRAAADPPPASAASDKRRRGGDVGWSRVIFPPPTTSSTHSRPCPPTTPPRVPVPCSGGGGSFRHRSAARAPEQYGTHGRTAASSCARNAPDSHFAVSSQPCRPTLIPVSSGAPDERRGRGGGHAVADSTSGYSHSSSQAQAWATHDLPPEMNWKGGSPPSPLQGAQPTPSHCLRDAKCQPQWHLQPTVTAPNRFGSLLQPPIEPLIGPPPRQLPLQCIPPPLFYIDGCPVKGHPKRLRAQVRAAQVDYGNAAAAPRGPVSSADRHPTRRRAGGARWCTVVARHQCIIVHPMCPVCPRRHALVPPSPAIAVVQCCQEFLFREITRKFLGHLGSAQNTPPPPSIHPQSMHRKRVHQDLGISPTPSCQDPARRYRCPRRRPWGPSAWVAV